MTPEGMVLARYLAGESVSNFAETLRTLPDNVEIVPATGVVLKLLETSSFARYCRRLPQTVIRRVLASEVAGSRHLFLRLAVALDGTSKALEAAWSRAVTAIADLETTYAWGSKQCKAKIRGVASDPVLLHAIQGTVANSEAASLSMMAVLVTDGSVASYDALVPHLDRAVGTEGRRLDLLRRLRVHAAKTPALDALLAEVDDALQARNDRSPALALAELIGVGAQRMFWFSITIGSHEITRGNVPRFQGTVRVDSRAANWYSVSISDSELRQDRRMPGTSFGATETHYDGLELGRCEAAAIPTWLVASAATLGTTLSQSHCSSNLRGAKRDRIGAWLAGR